MIKRKSVYHSASEERLEKLIKERLDSKANKQAIDNRIWDLFGETWCIMFTDLSGFSRNVEKFGIIQFLQTIYESDRVLVPIIEVHDGIILKAEGDSYLIIFRNVEKALHAGIAMQKELVKYNKSKEKEEQILLCIGLGYGQVLRVADNDVFGHEVNTASKIGEDIAKSGDILVTESVIAQLKKPKFKFNEHKTDKKELGKIYSLTY